MLPTIYSRQRPSRHGSGRLRDERITLLTQGRHDHYNATRSYYVRAITNDAMEGKMAASSGDVEIK
jgi:hypothetical protein